MRKYWYYTYIARASRGFGVIYFKENEFDVLETMRFLSRGLRISVENLVITNWKEISSDQYNKLIDYLDKQKKSYE